MLQSKNKITVVNCAADKMIQGVHYIHAIVQNYGLCGTFFAMAVSYTSKIF